MSASFASEEGHPNSEVHLSSSLQQKTSSNISSLHRFPEPNFPKPPFAWLGIEPEENNTMAESKCFLHLEIGGAALHLHSLYTVKVQGATDILFQQLKTPDHQTKCVSSSVICPGGGGHTAILYGILTDKRVRPYRM